MGSPGRAGRKEERFGLQDRPGDTGITGRNDSVQSGGGSDPDGFDECAGCDDLVR